MIQESEIKLSTNKVFDAESVLEIYRLNKWSSADKPQKLLSALKNSHSLVTAYYQDKLVGIGYAISDGNLVVYYPHLLVHPTFQGQGIGQKMVDKFQEIYDGFHMQMLVADGKAINFYEKCGFEIAGETKSMWKYKGGDH